MQCTTITVCFVIGVYSFFIRLLQDFSVVLFILTNSTSSTLLGRTLWKYRALIMIGGANEWFLYLLWGSYHTSDIALILPLRCFIFTCNVVIFFAAGQLFRKVVPPVVSWSAFRPIGNLLPAFGQSVTFAALIIASMIDVVVIWVVFFVVASCKEMSHYYQLACLLLVGFMHMRV